MRETAARLIALVTVIVIAIVVMAFAAQQSSRKQDLAGQPDPEQWAKLFPLHVEAFMTGTAQMSGTPLDKLAANPFRQRAWAGHPFADEYMAARGHYYAQIDQQQSRRTLEHDQPAGCIHCHAAEAPALVEQLGWEGLNAMRYDEVRDLVHHGSSCSDCHRAEDMSLQISRPALITALSQQGIDVVDASRQEMQTYVCAQCHVEYYFEAESGNLTLPLASGWVLEDIERHFDQRSFSDWTHAETGAELVKMQHPNFELHEQGVHAAVDVTCVDCHMPVVQQGGMQVTDHSMGSPLQRVEAACSSCHQQSSEAQLRNWTERIQANTDALLEGTEQALNELMDALVAAQSTGSIESALGVESAADVGENSTQLALARQAQRQAQLRWDFIDADASRGFHASQEATRILTDAQRIAREGLQQLLPPTIEE